MREELTRSKASKERARLVDEQKERRTDRQTVRQIDREIDRGRGRERDTDREREREKMGTRSNGKKRIVTDAKTDFSSKTK